MHEHTFWELYALDSALIPLYAVFLGILGAVLGSFFDCVAARHAAGESPWKGRSKCDSCGRELGALELIPIFSYLFQRGRCRKCGAKIPADALWAEIAGAAGAVAITLRFGLSLETVQWLIFGALLLWLSLEDHHRRILPDGLLIAAAVVRLAFWLIPPDRLARLPGLIGSALSVSLPLLILVLIMDKVMKRETMGGGDIKLFFVVGLYFTWPETVLTLLVSCLLGLLYAVLTRKKRTDPMPFGPWIALGTVVTAVFGGPLIDWYLSLLI